MLPSDVRFDYISGLNAVAWSARCIFFRLSKTDGIKDYSKYRQRSIAERFDISFENKHTKKFVWCYLVTIIRKFLAARRFRPGLILIGWYNLTRCLNSDWSSPGTGAMEQLLGFNATHFCKINILLPTNCWEREERPPSWFCDTHIPRWQKKIHSHWPHIIVIRMQPQQIKL